MTPTTSLDAILMKRAAAIKQLTEFNLVDCIALWEEDEAYRAEERDNAREPGDRPWPTTAANGKPGPEMIILDIVRRGMDYGSYTRPQLGYLKVLQSKLTDSNTITPAGPTKAAAPESIFSFPAKSKANRSGISGTITHAEWKAVGQFGRSARRVGEAEQAEVLHVTIRQNDGTEMSGKILNNTWSISEAHEPAAAFIGRSVSIASATIKGRWFSYPKGVTVLSAPGNPNQTA
jgi:hypothetical protein